MNKQQFIANYSHWDNYKPMLWEALQCTDGDVLELGMGDGSTSLLHDYCKENQRRLYSYDSDLEWYRKFEKFRTKPSVTYCHEINYAQDWDNVAEKHRENVGVILADHAPGERRKHDVALFCNIAKVIVCHDTEPQSDHGYRFSLVWPLLKYVRHFEGSGAWASAASNFIDVTKWAL